MRVWVKTMLILVYLLIATVLYVYIWMHNADYFPDYPEWVGELAVFLSGPFSKPDDIEVVHDFYITMVAFFNVLVFSLAAYGLYRLIRK